jgi:hypothetical protein
MTIILQAEMLDFLRRSEPMPAVKASLKRTFQEFVVEYGWWYEPVELHQRLATGTPQERNRPDTRR